MKKHYNKLVIAFCGLILFAACKKKETEINYADNATPPVLTANITNNDSVVLMPADSSATALTLSWTNPDYAFSNGVSSLNVNYTVQIDTVGADFTNPNMVQISIPSELGTSFTGADLNTKLFGSLFLQTGVPHHIAIRVESFLNQGSLPLYSNILTYTITPYAIPPKVAPPTSGTLFITGSATTDGWMVGGTPSSVTSPVNQQFTMVTPTLYKITVPLIGGQEFLLVPVAGDWTDKYSCVSKAAQLKTGGSFGLNKSDNFPGPDASGTYTITVNFQTGLYTVTQ